MMFKKFIVAKESCAVVKFFVLLVYVCDFILYRNLMCSLFYVPWSTELSNAQYFEFMKLKEVKKT